jgi:hypothetical protein
MNEEAKKTNESPSSNFQDETPKDKIPAGDKVVKKSEDKDYNKEEAGFKDPAKRRETDEQPVNPVKTPPKD